MADELTLRVGGRRYGGWQAVHIRRGMDQACAEFELEVTDLWPGSDREPREIAPGDACQVLVGERAVITGYVDEVGLHHNANQHVTAVRGRCKTADLVDCSAVRAKGGWAKHTLAQIAADLCKPFGIKVQDEAADTHRFPVFALQQGETVFEALERLARARAVLLTSNGAGDLVITRAGKTLASTPLVLGRNIIEASGSLNMRDRYSSYVLKGQSKGADFWSGKQAAAVTAKASDGGVARYRPLVVVSEAQGSGVSLKQRVAWEANVRAARSTEVSVRVHGWSHANGLWEPNTRVRLTNRWLRLDDTLLISGVAYQLNEAGTTCELQLTRPDAFDILPTPMARPGIKQPFWAPAGAQ